MEVIASPALEAAGFRSTSKSPQAHRHLSVKKHRLGCIGSGWLGQSGKSEAGRAYLKLEFFISIQRRRRPISAQRRLQLGSVELHALPGKFRNGWHFRRFSALT